MKRLLITAAALAIAAPAYAGNVTVTTYSLPDPDASNDVTTNGYSYYTGPILFSVLGGGTLEVYCADLEHDVYQNTTYTYAYTKLTENGAGQAISFANSFRIGKIAQLGFADETLGTTAGYDLAAAAQAAIWDIEYDTTSSATGQIATDIGVAGVSGFLGETFSGTPTWALALDPVGENWPQNTQATQQMVVGLSSVPEPSTWIMGALGFAMMASLGLIKSRKTPFAIEV